MSWHPGLKPYKVISVFYEYISLFKVRLCLVVFMCYLYVYLRVCSASVATTEAWVTASVLQTEACFVSLCHLTASVYVQQIIETECVHAVVMPVECSQRTTNLLHLNLQAVRCLTMNLAPDEHFFGTNVIV